MKKSGLKTHLRELIFQNFLTPSLRKLGPTGLVAVVTAFYKSRPPFSIPLYAPVYLAASIVTTCLSEKLYENHFKLRKFRKNSENIRVGPGVP